MSDRLTATAPQTIYLCVSDEDHDRDEPFPSNVDDVTWSTDGPVNVTVEYVRADLVPTWKDAPDAPGTWVIDYVLYHNRFIRLCKLRELGHPTLLEGRFMDSAVYRSDAEFPKGRWFGPIPSEDK